MMNEQQLTAALQRYFGFAHFRPGQLATLQALTAGQSALAILPTGAGKTLVYQLMGKLTPGLVVIVSPLLSLMQDQLNRLRLAGEKRAAMISSLVDLAERRQLLGHLGDLHFLFVSPEMISSQPVLAALKQCQLSLVVVDEAHCVSEWGPDFRPHYLLLAGVLQRLGRPQTLMLTATATPRVAADIISKLGFADGEVTVIRRPVDRPNIFLAVQPVSGDQEKRQRLQQLVTELGGGGIIYFSSRKLASQTAAWLTEQTGLLTAPYHAGIDPVNRYRIQQQFMNDELQVICATSAFGMGIDKDDVRYVIHYHLPRSLEAYVQEIGRAGRNGAESLAILLYAAGDEQLPLSLNAVDLPTDAVMAAYQQGRVKEEALGSSADVVAFYLDHGLSPRRVRELFANRWQTITGQVRMMVNYATRTGCLRQLIADHFGEQLGTKPPYCCSRDNANWLATVQLPPAKQGAAQTRPLDWRERLAGLFNLENN